MRLALLPLCVQQVRSSSEQEKRGAVNGKVSVNILFRWASQKGEEEGGKNVREKSGKPVDGKQKGL